MSEILLASHCAPALAGIKPANIVSCLKSSGLKSDIEKLNNELNASGIYAEILCQCESRAVVIVYRKDVIERHLGLKCHRDFWRPSAILKRVRCRIISVYLKNGSAVKGFLMRSAFFWVIR